MKKLVYGSSGYERLSHTWIRFPARFHPPVANALVREYSRTNQRVLDPFCGSGSVLLEALTEGRHATGIDTDPFAVFISKVKTRPLSLSALSRSTDFLLSELDRLERRPEQYFLGQFIDLRDRSVEDALRRDKLWRPALPNIFHWFRRYVVVDLARILAAIRSLEIPNAHKDFFLLAFAATLRRTSNADPVPISGVEVTALMRKRDGEGRIINPFDVLRHVIGKNLQEVANVKELIPAGFRAHVRLGDATQIARHVRTPIGAVITSPPYHNAVDYHRRHLLEMYWLSLVQDAESRAALKARYLGSRGVMRHRFVTEGVIESPLALSWYSRMLRESPSRAAEFKHYTVGMSRFFAQLARAPLARKAKVVMVLGHSAWNGSQIPTSRLFTELAKPHFRLVDSFTYPVKNHFMSYARRNHAAIDREYGIVLEQANKV